MWERATNVTDEFAESVTDSTLLGHVIEGTVGGIVGAVTFYLIAHLLARWVRWRAQRKDQGHPAA